ncbi:MAG: sialidase family protein [Pirellulales bacterium]
MRRTASRCSSARPRLAGCIAGCSAQEKEIREVDSLPDRLTDDELRAYNEPDWTQTELQCTPRGQVLLLPGERSVFDLNAATAERLRTERAARWNGLNAAEQRQLVRQTIGSEAGWAGEVPPVEMLGSLPRDGYSIRKLAMTVAGGVRLPALAFVPDQPTGPAVLYLHGTSMATDAGPDGPIAALVRKGHVVLAAELRGIGETETGRGKKEFGKGRFGPDNLEIFVAYLMGKSFVGLRTEDALRWSAYLREGALVDRRPSELHLTAIGEAAVPALHAAALAEDAFRTVTVRRMIPSWEAVVAAPETFNQSVNVVHGVLRHYDLADLVPLAGANRVSILETVDAMGRPAQEAETPEFEVTAAPMSVVRERPGITGAGWLATVRTGTAGDLPQLRLTYPNHADDWGKSTGTGASLSRDGGRTWTAEPDDAPLKEMVDQWIQQLADGSMLTVGIRSVPDPKTRTTVETSERSAWVVGRSTDFGASWKTADCRIECPAALGVIARPLPPVLEDAEGTLYMPAYSWSTTGSRALLLASDDRGLRWTVRGVIAEAAAIRAAGVPVTTPWLETTVARTTDGGWFAVIRTGSGAKPR